MVPRIGLKPMTHTLEECCCYSTELTRHLVEHSRLSGVSFFKPDKLFQGGRHPKFQKTGSCLSPTVFTPFGRFVYLGFNRPTHGAPCRTRTCGPMIKSHVLEPTQLKAHIEARHFHNNYKQLSILQIGQSAYSLVRLSEDISVGYWRSTSAPTAPSRIDFTPPQSKTTYVSL